MNKGFIITVITEDGQRYPQPGIPSIAKALYECRRYYNHLQRLDGKNVKYVDIQVASVLIYRYAIQARQEFIQMGMMSQFNREHQEKRAQNAKEENRFLPFLDGKNKDGKEGPGKDLLVRKGLPFTVAAIRYVSGDYGNQICYDIYFDRESREFKTLQSIYDLEPGYTLKLPDTPWRRVQIDTVLSPHYKGRTDKRLILIQTTKEYNFDDYNPAQGS